MPALPKGVYLQGDVCYRGYQGIRGIVDASIADLRLGHWKTGVLQVTGCTSLHFGLRPALALIQKLHYYLSYRLNLNIRHSQGGRSG